MYRERELYYIIINIYIYIYIEREICNMYMFCCYCLICFTSSTPMSVEKFPSWWQQPGPE